MRDVADALRSLKKYVAEVLVGEPPLALISFGASHWTIYGQVSGATSVAEESWRWLLSQDRNPATVHGSVADPTTWYQESVLVSDPTAAAAADGIDLTGVVASSTAIITLGDWTVRFWADRGEFKRPFARVGLVGGATVGGGALLTEIVQPFSIECYPAQAATADEALLAAAVIQAALIQAFALEGVNLGRPKRIPLWDYGGVPITSAAPTNGRNASDFMRVVDFSTNILPYPEEPRDIAVVVDLRLSWRKGVDQFRLRDRNGVPVLGTHVTQAVRLKQVPE